MVIFQMDNISFTSPGLEPSERFNTQGLEITLRTLVIIDNHLHQSIHYGDRTQKPYIWSLNKLCNEETESVRRSA